MNSVDESQPAPTAEPTTEPRPDQELETVRQELETVLATAEHIATVRRFIGRAVTELLERVTDHDASKLASPEREGFARHARLLRAVSYGSSEYARLLERLYPTLSHHYRANRHHPEHHTRGVSNMTLVDLVEMLADWQAACQRHDPVADIHDSIEHNRKRFGLSDQLAQILHNSVFQRPAARPIDHSIADSVFALVDSAGGIATVKKASHALRQIFELDNPAIMQQFLRNISRNAAGTKQLINAANAGLNIAASIIKYSRQSPPPTAQPDSETEV